MITPIFALLPSFGSEVTTAIGQAVVYLVDGVQLLACFFSPSALSFFGFCIQFIIGVELFIKAWGICWWVIEKIPFFGVQE